MKRKGILIILILLVIAAVLAVVFVFLFKDKNTKSLAVDLNAAVAKGYLSEDSKEYKTIHEYLIEYAGMANKENGEAGEVTNYLQAYEAYVNISIFFNNEARFMEHTKTYSKNRRTVVSNLKSAQKAADKLVEDIEEKKKITGGNETWQRVVWKACKEYVQTTVLDTLKAFEAMTAIYKSSVASAYLNNDLTDVLFMGLKHLNSEFKKNVEKQPNLGAKLKTFSDSYFNPAIIENAVLNYSYGSASVRTDIKELKENGEKSLRWNTFISGSLHIV